MFGTLLRRWLRILALLCVVGLPALSLYDWLAPWPPAVRALDAFPGQHRICVGLGGQSGATHWTRQRSYLLFPRLLTSPSVVSVSSFDDAPPVLSESRLAFWLLAAACLAALVVCLEAIRFITPRQPSLRQQPS